MEEPQPGTIDYTSVASICLILNNMRLFFLAIAGGIAVISILFNGTRVMRDWAEAGSFAKAKQSFVHTLVGLVIVVVATEFVSLITAPVC